jgi:hypothetical protein
MLICIVLKRDPGEVFKIQLTGVDEMIENRFQAGDSKSPEEDGLWSQELWVEG